MVPLGSDMAGDIATEIFWLWGRINATALSARERWLSGLKNASKEMGSHAQDFLHSILF